VNLALREPPARDGAGGPFRILLVDDSATIRGLLRRAVENERDIAVVGSVGNGKQALEALGRNDPEIVGLDIEMPEMDGMTALPLLVAK
jgi:two-component system chemotaxis response regulator CheB